METFFFQSRPEALPVYLRLREELMQRWPETVIEVKKTQITLREKYGYAFVSLPRRRGNAGIVVSFGLGAEVHHARIACAVEAYPGRWTHHVPVPSAEAVDGELLGWLEASRAFSAAKR
ncbi:MAG: hypothetical protein E7469_03955 [Ruminococcaceae bacterium]|nr:hypothetical protein [Oscillospiraceae bacterium]